MALQRYSVIERLDAGGMAEVFKGKASSIQGIEKLVAIKRILPSLTRNKKFVAMFLDEARLSMTLNHANIVQVFDLGVADETYFIVMEYVDGANLKVVSEAARRTGYRIPYQQSIYIMMEVCKALAHAHTKKDISGRPLCIVHRDVSPPNILLSAEGEVKLTDFGLAKAQSQIESTEPGVVKGKFSYLAPEAAYGEEVDHRCDIYAAGIILWELIAGKRLFLGSSDMETLELVRRGHVPGLAQVAPDIHPELDRIVMRALAQRPEDRYASAQEMGDDLAHYIFSRGLKVTSYDISQLVGLVLSGKLGETPRQARPLSLIDQLIVGQLEQFRSIQADSRPGVADAQPSYDGSQPLSLSDLSVGSPGSPARSPGQGQGWLEEALQEDRDAAEGGSGLLLDPPPGARAEGAGSRPRTAPRVPSIARSAVAFGRDLRRMQRPVSGVPRSSPAAAAREGVAPRVSGAAQAAASGRNGADRLAQAQAQAESTSRPGPVGDVRPVSPSPDDAASPWGARQWLLVLLLLVLLGAGGASLYLYVLPAMG